MDSKGLPKSGKTAAVSARLLIQIVHWAHILRAGKGQHPTWNFRGTRVAWCHAVVNVTSAAEAQDSPILIAVDDSSVLACKLGELGDAALKSA